jgi:2-haloacid dehalogenase
MRTVLGCVAIAISVAFAIASTPFAHSAASVERGVRKQYAAVAFDYLVLFDPDSVVSAVDRIAPGRGREFTNLWRSRQFEYSWLRSISGRYVDFAAITSDALLFTANALHIELTAAQRDQLQDAYLHLTPWPDTADALRRLRAADVRVITIANFSPAMLRANAESAGLTPLFDALVSTDENHSYKPEPRAYQLGIERLGLAKGDIVFAAFGGWDAAGAKSFGFPTVWVNRFNQPQEELGVSPDLMVGDLKGLLDFVLK